MSLKPVRDRIAILRDIILKLEKTEDRVLDPVMRANLVRLLLDHIAELDAAVSVEPPLQATPEQPDPCLRSRRHGRTLEPQMNSIDCALFCHEEGVLIVAFTLLLIIAKHRASSFCSVRCLNISCRSVVTYKVNVTRAEGMRLRLSKYEVAK